MRHKTRKWHFYPLNDIFPKVYSMTQCCNQHCEIIVLQLTYKKSKTFLVVFLPFSPGRWLPAPLVAMTLTRAHSFFVSVYAKVWESVEPPELRRIVSHCHSGALEYVLDSPPMCVVMMENSGCGSSWMVMRTTIKTDAVWTLEEVKAAW